MYAYLKGILISFTPNYAVVEVQGVGYSVFIPCSVLSQLPHIGQPIQFYTSFIVREHSHALYGFLSVEERDVFEVLLNVTGVGPKLGLSLIGHLPWHSLQTAITHEDISTLCKVPGVGKKTAERLIIELRDKLPNLMSTKMTELSTSTLKGGNSGIIQDAVLALINLGYNQSAAQKAVKQSLKDLPENSELAVIITNALKSVHKI